MAMSIPIFSQTNNNGNINSNCFETQYQWQWQYQFLFKPISMAIPIAMVAPRQYQWQYQYQLFSSAISMSMAISIVSIALSQYQCSINQYLSKLININGNVNCSKNTLSIVNGNNNTSKIVNTNGCQYYCSCLLYIVWFGHNLLKSLADFREITPKIATACVNCSTKLFS